MSKQFWRFIVAYILKLHIKVDELEEKIIKLEQFQREMKDILEDDNYERSGK